MPFGGLQRTGLRGGQTIIINGATGYFGSGAVMLAVAMGAGRVVAVGRKQAALESLRDAFGPRVIPARRQRRCRPTTSRPSATPPAATPMSRSICSVPPRAPRPRSRTLRALKRGGRLVLMGSAEVPLELSFREMLANDWEVVGQFMYERTAPGQLATLAAEGLLDLKKIVVSSYTLADFRRRSRRPP